MRYLLIVLSLLFVPLSAAKADVNVGVVFNTPGVSIGINVPAYPRLVRIPGYPVYYDPYVRGNYFFYDGLYWAFYGDGWYASSWYNGPWYAVDIYQVPVFILRVPVRYYREPPAYFHGWHRDAPPRWGEHWGREWEQRRNGWDRWNRKAAPAPAPLPSYQRSYKGERYPEAVDQQHSIRTERYRYQPREPVTQEFYQRNREQNQQREQFQQRQQSQPQYQQREQSQQREQKGQRGPQGDDRKDKRDEHGQDRR
jgi:hypothetical protein